MVVAFRPDELAAATRRIRETSFIIREPSSGQIGVAFGAIPQGYDLLGTLPPLYPEWLGNRAFLEAHGLRFPYVGGAMANGIASPAMVIALGRAGMLGFLGTAGLTLEKMRGYIEATKAELHGQGAPWGANLIHSPQQPAMEMATVELFLELGVRRVSASAFMRLTPAAVRYSAAGLKLLPDGTIKRQNHLFAKISRPEVATHFMSPAPAPILSRLVEEGLLTAQEARLASQIPVAADIIVEGDSGGHTDNRPLAALFPVLSKLRDTIQTKYNYARQLRLGAAGGLGTPQALASAFALGADFVLTGSINQASLEAAQSTAVKELLSRAAFTDVIMAPAGDMFEMGVEVQVLRRGTLFGTRAKRLFEVYSRYQSIEEIPTELRHTLERDIFGEDMEKIWEKTRAFFEVNDKTQIWRAQENPKHKLALICRWYLGLSSQWAIQGKEDRLMDYQIWMGPAQGAFNDWVKGTFLEPPANRDILSMALNLMEGAAVITRAHQLRSFGCPIPPEALNFRPQPIG